MSRKGEGRGEEIEVAGPQKMNKRMMRHVQMDFDVLCVLRAKDYRCSGCEK